MLIELKIFSEIKHQLDGFVFWKIREDGNVEVIRAAPNERVKRLLQSLNKIQPLKSATLPTT